MLSSARALLIGFTVLTAGFCCRQPADRWYRFSVLRALVPEVGVPTLPHTGKMIAVAIDHGLLGVLAVEKAGGRLGVSQLI